MKKLIILLLSGLIVTSAFAVAPKADKIRLADAGSIITATEVEGALQENRTALDLNTTHRSSTGEDHTYIDQDVTSGSTPTFTNTNFTEATDKNYVTDAQQAVIVNTSGTNTGDVTVTDSDELDLTLTGQDLTATLKAGSIDETKLDTSVNASLDLADSAIQTETDPLSLHINGTNVPTADYSWTTSLTTTGTLSGGTLTDGTATLTGGELTATSIVVGDNEPIEIGVGGLSGALGSDGKLYSDGTNVRLQVESPYSMFEVQNPDITFEYFQVHATAPFYIPVLHFGKGGAFDGLGVIDYYLYVQDISHTNDGVIFIPNKNFPTDKHTGLLSFISASNQLQFLTQGAGSYIKLDPYSHTETDQDFKINVDGKKLYFGAADDASITYDGTNLLIDPKEVGSGYLQVDGEILATDK